MDRQTQELLALLAGWLLIAESVLDEFGAPVGDVSAHVNGHAPITLHEWLAVSRHVVQKHAQQRQ
jgi:hypothetical protein